MKHLLTLLAALLFTINISKAQTVKNEIRIIGGKKYIIYQIKAGETWSSIAEKSGITERSLIDANEKANGSLKNVKTLKVPMGKSTKHVLAENTDNTKKVNPTEAVLPIVKNQQINISKVDSGEKQTDHQPKIFGSTLRTEIKGNKTLTIYKTGNGDNINALAKYFNSSAVDIQTQNNLVYGKFLPGKILKIWSKNVDTLNTPLLVTEKVKKATNEGIVQVEKSIDSNDNTIETKSVIEEAESNEPKRQLKANETIIGDYLVVKKIGKLYIKHTVISGEDLTRISKETYTTNAKIIGANNLNKTKLHTGQLLLIPTNKQILFKLTGLNFDEIAKKKNDNVLEEENTVEADQITENDVPNETKETPTIQTKTNKIDSSKNNTSVPIIEKNAELANNALKFTKEINANELHANSNVGDTKVGFTHSVLAGETIEMIAKKYKISISDIANWNNLNQNKIRVGQELIVNFKRANKSYLLANSISPESKNQLKNSGQSANIKLVEEKGLCFLSDEKFMGIAHKNAPVGTLLLLTNSENYKKIYVRVTSVLVNSNADVVIQVDKHTAKEMAFNSSLTNVSLSYSTIE